MNDESKQGSAQKRKPCEVLKRSCERTAQHLSTQTTIKRQKVKDEDNFIRCKNRARSTNWNSGKLDITANIFDSKTFR